MARSLIVPVVEVRDIREHPQASLLSIVDVLGYQMVTGLVEDPSGPIRRKFVPGIRDAKGKRVPLERTDQPIKRAAAFFGPATGRGATSETPVGRTGRFVS